MQGNFTIIFDEVGFRKKMSVRERSWNFLLQRISAIESMINRLQQIVNFLNGFVSV